MSGSLRGRLSRRQWLGASAAGLGLPLLSSLKARSEQPAFPKRFLTVYTPNGRIHDAWFPANVVSETEWDLGESMQPLAAFRDRLLILRGVDLAVTVTGPGGPHQRGIGALFSGRELQEGSFVDGCGSLAGFVNGISVDQEVANHIGVDTPIKSLELAVRAIEADVQSRISYSGPGEPLPPMNDPAQVHARLFSGLSAPSLENDDPLAERLNVVATVKAQFGRLQSRVSAQDAVKLEQHLDLLRDVERRLGIDAGTCVAPDPPGAVNPNGEDDMPGILAAHLDLLAAAFTCDLTRVASLQISTGQNRIRYPWVNSLGEGHALSHAGPTNEAARQELIARERWHAEMLAAFLQRLADTPEGDGTLLDNTLVLWGTDVSVGNTHALTNLPYLMIGSAGGYFRTGRYLEYMSASNSDLLVSVLNAMGVEATTFGHPDFVTGPLSGLV